MIEEQDKTKEKSYLMFEEAKTFQEMKVDEERKGVLSVTLQSITHHDRFVNTVEVEYMEKDPNYPDGDINKREKLLLPAIGMLGVDVIQYTRLKTFIGHFPIQIFNEVWNRTPVTPYTTSDGKTGISCKIKLKKEESRWYEMYSIEIDIENVEDLKKINIARSDKI